MYLQETCGRRAYVALHTHLHGLGVSSMMAQSNLQNTNATIDQTSNGGTVNSGNSGLSWTDASLNATNTDFTTN